MQVDAPQHFVLAKSFPQSFDDDYRFFANFGQFLLLFLFCLAYRFCLLIGHLLALLPFRMQLLFGLFYHGPNVNTIVGVGRIPGLICLGFFHIVVIAGP